MNLFKADMVTIIRCAGRKGRGRGREEREEERKEKGESRRVGGGVEGRKG